jgi:hypothetical protein
MAIGMRAPSPGITTVLGIITAPGILLMAPVIENLQMGHDTAAEVAKLVGYLLIVIYHC